MGSTAENSLARNGPALRTAQALLEVGDERARRGEAEAIELRGELSRAFAQRAGEPVVGAVELGGDTDRADAHIDADQRTAVPAPDGDRLSHRLGGGAQRRVELELAAQPLVAAADADPHPYEGDVASPPEQQRDVEAEAARSARVEPAYAARALVDLSLLGRVGVRAHEDARRTHGGAQRVGPDRPVAAC